ncbi:MAG: phage tail protein [Chloroflexi bacterium]|jgi:phage tail-like protein|nr:phage tail protein [Chloroflexota bacterium]MBK6710787.1 phage tail protein [Chloroflexota bacterium]MBK7176470.1 phage tail protein [Chloroflexota bacterium]MBK7915451.1 phage tail protein [Chloroflexota bacterium]MBK8933916.1 phage tail protein [Chloroflexota bacterium]
MAERTDPLVGFHFGVDIQGVITGYFTECSGLGSEHEAIEHKVVTEKGQEVVLKLPGRLKWENIVLKRGITGNMDVWDWRKQVEDGDVEGARRDGSIVMFDQKLAEVARWNFERAWPLKVTGPQPKADSNEIGIEELTIAHEYIARVK